MEADRLTHVGADGRATMVDVSAKPATDRRAVAVSRITVSTEVLDLIERGEMPKGAVLTHRGILHNAAAIATNLDRRLFMTTVIGLGSNVALNLAFIPRWGINGAATATVIAEAVTVALLLAQLRQHLAVDPVA